MPPEPRPSSETPATRLHHVAATVHGRMWVRSAADGTSGRWLVGFHGYGQTAEIFLEWLTRTPDIARWTLVAIQALHPFYAARGTEVVANWMTRQDRELAIADNVAYVDAALDRLEPELGAPRALVMAGFSQGVAMAYRAAVLGRRACDGIVAAGGDVPPELVDLGDGAWPPEFAPRAARPWPPVLAATGAADRAYPPAALERDLAVLRGRGARVQEHVHPGGHEWPESLAAALSEMLAGI